MLPVSVVRSFCARSFAFYHFLPRRLHNLARQLNPRKIRTEIRVQLWDLAHPPCNRKRFQSCIKPFFWSASFHQLPCVCDSVLFPNSASSLRVLEFLLPCLTAFQCTRPSKYITETDLIKFSVCRVQLLPFPVVAGLFSSSDWGLIQIWDPAGSWKMENVTAAVSNYNGYSSVSLNVWQIHLIIKEKLCPKKKKNLYVDTVLELCSDMVAVVVYLEEL